MGSKLSLDKTNEKAVAKMADRIDALLASADADETALALSAEGGGSEEVPTADGADGADVGKVALSPKELSSSALDAHKRLRDATEARRLAEAERANPPTHTASAAAAPSGGASSGSGGSEGRAAARPSRRKLLAKTATAAGLTPVRGENAAPNLVR